METQGGPESLAPSHKCLQNKQPLAQEIRLWPCHDSVSLVFTCPNQAPATKVPSVVFQERHPWPKALGPCFGSKTFHVSPASPDPRSYPRHVRFIYTSHGLLAKNTHRGSGAACWGQVQQHQLNHLKHVSAHIWGNATRYDQEEEIQRDSAVD